ncbi:uncharacterized protein AB675_4730 [Cyphellophora attinorum]|uniref:Uncharacterized protein n=1 Tax=Cyphellophora attinorum TaxID=1664694 RepID=A0A0N0NLB3_9EURO|nr:uncharacterized protein AB675_4730 [Phialophora attinorum]KPI39091.1 hypothetical protein AB675_4730 [Phialophora attinorum]
MASATPPAKRVKTEFAEIPANFSVGDKVYVSGLPDATRKTLFEVHEVIGGGSEWRYPIKNNAVMFEGATMFVKESHLFTIEHEIGTKFIEDIVGSHGKTIAYTCIDDWHFVGGRVVYDLSLTRDVERRDKPTEVLKVGRLGEVEVLGKITSKIYRDRASRRVLYFGTEFCDVTVKATADQLGPVYRG